MKHSQWFAALAITVGFMVAEYVPGRLSTLYVEVLGPFFAGAWLSALFHRWWGRNQERVLALPSTTLYALVAVAGFMLIAGGIRLLWVEPFLFAPMLWPLVEIALTLRSRKQSSTAIR